MLGKGTHLMKSPGIQAPARRSDIVRREVLPHCEPLLKDGGLLYYYLDLAPAHHLT